MQDFGSAFLISNLSAALLIGTAALAVSIFNRMLSARLRYGIWMAAFLLLTVPFLPIRFERVWSSTGSAVGAGATQTALQTGVSTEAGGAALSGIQDFAADMSGEIPQWISYMVLAVWLAGIGISLFFFAKNMWSGKVLEQSAAPLENPEILEIYRQCVEELNIKRKIPLLATAYLKSPVIVGVIRPKVYFPMRIAGGYCVNSQAGSAEEEQSREKQNRENAQKFGSRQQAIRYMLLHELQHYRHRDNLINLLAELLGAVYWFHPAVRYAACRLKIERETACDEAVLNMLKKEEYRHYADTLLDLASGRPYGLTPVSAGISGGMREMRARIRNIAGFKEFTGRRRAGGVALFCLVSVFLVSFVPFLSVRAGGNGSYEFDMTGKNIVSTDLSAYFGDNAGTFVLYEQGKDQWTIYNEDMALSRMAPLSTWKIYDALLGLESGIISPEASEMEWDGTLYWTDTWERDQNLDTAIRNSVNWYFHAIDRVAGMEQVKDFVEQIGYGNQNPGRDPENYWLDSTLEISPVEQVEMLQKLYDNTFGFQPQNIEAVKQAILLETGEGYSVYGKTGTGEKNGINVCGWFVGYIETEEGPCFFAALLEGDSDATGSLAAQVTGEILKDMLS